MASLHFHTADSFLTHHDYQARCDSDKHLHSDPFRHTDFEDQEG